MISNTTLIGALMVRRGEADAMICGTYGTYRQHFDIVENVIGYAREDKVASAMNALILPTGNIFIADTYVSANPDAGQLAAITEISAKGGQAFGIAPRWRCCPTPAFARCKARAPARCARRWR